MYYTVMVKKKKNIRNFYINYYCDSVYSNNIYLLFIFSFIHLFLFIYLFLIYLFTYYFQTLLNIIKTFYIYLDLDLLQKISKPF